MGQRQRHHPTDAPAGPGDDRDATGQHTGQHGDWGFQVIMPCWVVHSWVSFSVFGAKDLGN